tara:strand:- start:306 stop:707 length:402 start_codon:yes stop_codon:yes gene_type:complete
MINECIFCFEDLNEDLIENNLCNCKFKYHNLCYSKWLYNKERKCIICSKAIDFNSIYLEVNNENIEIENDERIENNLNIEIETNESEYDSDNESENLLIYNRYINKKNNCKQFIQIFFCILFWIFLFYIIFYL